MVSLVPLLIAAEAGATPSAAGADQVLRYKGFNVEIKGPDGGSDHGAWKTLNGGASVIEVIEATTGEESTFTIGNVFLPDLTLVRIGEGSISVLTTAASYDFPRR